ncbi:unnamed protein product [Aspergillus oryzae var. brunneus]|uniref:Unnamed protein product n=2 Tax=Aspergillus oryzae TaxID=5062 RepID=A0AAN4YRG4_ASPOZ|nr:unnamed protein product [Aspergillus oryzae]GMG33440.1 unnamed protein product [Aspergillus oryzae]GMG54270.1 unnamed protein product [Aspergillus oryzae var. brunneus]
MASTEEQSDKTAKSQITTNVEVEQGHLDELSEDIDEKVEYDYESERSPFPEDLPVNTVRMWFLGIVFTILGSGINQFFSLRYPSVHIVSLVAELLAYPCGVFLAKVLPVVTINLGPLGSFCLNPDHHFNIKEHAMIVIMSNVSFGYGSADSTNIIQAASPKFYNFGLKAGFSVLVVLCAQLLGFGVAGLAAPWLVEPASIIWPQVLSNCAMLETLHSRANSVANGWKISRLRFFLYVTAGGFIWYFFPGLMFTALSYFTWICWIAPRNAVVNQLFGMQTGLGLSPITFDWSQVAYNTNPLLSPSWAAVNVFAGFAAFFWIVVPGIFYTNTWFTAYLPLMTSDVYDRTGAVYDTARVISPQSTLDLEAYKSYSPPYLGATFAFVYGLSFASITGVLTHIGVWHYKDIWAAFRGKNRLDVHARLMKSYKKTPWYWYAAIIVAMTAISIAMVEVYKTKLPVYGIFLALAIPAIYMIPCGIVQGITNVNANQLNVLAEFIGGYMFEGKPLANMIFKILSTDVVGQGIYFAMDMKLGHYLKIPPRSLFLAQGLATILGALTQAGVTIWMLGHISDICSEDQPDGFSCPNATGINYSSWALVNFIFNHFIKRRFFAWWTKYNYILAAALDTGLALSGIVIFFCISYPGAAFPDWWGNTVYQNTADADGVPYKPMPKIGYFGPANGTWS